jgi:hypothetical protein
MDIRAWTVDELRRMGRAPFKISSTYSAGSDAGSAIKFIDPAEILAGNGPAQVWTGTTVRKV